MLETSDFLKDDCLKINCTVGVVVSETDRPRLHSIRVPESDIGDQFAVLLENEESSDVTFIVSGEKFYAHKLVLAARSTVFETEFSDRMEEDGCEILITDMEPKVFKALLHYIYRDTLIEDEGLSGTSAVTSVFNTLPAKLLAAADKYDLPRLRLMCESVFCKDISVDSVAHILALADHYRAMELKSICLRFAAANLVAVLRADGFQYLKDNYPSLQSEILKTVAGCDEVSGGGKSRSVYGRYSEGADTLDRSIRQQTWENGEEGNRSDWIPLPLVGDDAVDGSPMQEE
ncbi:hypothetical protein SLEP1_g39314 [Rubroshorea leprosula]|uniref:BTB domain-containing protein n=1 Tax=Rubroshorea leprosula TaxID=152421 RepID=A0AAV5L0Y4_9ROSI|nr:hypothetical protein SLEP1_g39314 [Rubroshorea leprosula]